jgi:2-furoyl-CoA dehydrogenase large subunit
MPYTTPNGCVYDSGNYPAMLKKAQELIGWDDWQKKIPEMRKEGRMAGIGIGTTLDSGTNNFGQARIINPFAPFSGNSKAANVKVDLYGEVVVCLGSVPQGQGHETTASQVVADVLNISPDTVHVRPGFDTDFNVHTGHTGTYASQFAVTGLSAIYGAAVKLKKELAQLAAFALEASADDLEFGVGKEGPELRVKGTDKAITYGALANIINVNNAGLPEDLDVTLNCRYVYRPPFKVPDIEKKYGNLTLTYAAQLHIAVVEVERDTFVPRILAYACVDDCGRAVNPKIVEGQVHGCTAHGIGAAIMETCAYDPAGNLLTSTFSDYTPITALNMPRLRYGHIETPSPFTFNGAKGMGEGGAAPLHTMCAAIQDAVHPLNVFVSDSHNTADSLFAAIEAAKSGAHGRGVRIQLSRNGGESKWEGGQDLM